ncbi:MAG TPA: hypothetical protein VLK22_03565 [Candidatus Udaeobacter sp.]|nr:hypothetical protein [Candidatus Udaeobacter sp.]
MLDDHERKIVVENCRILKELLLKLFPRCSRRYEANKNGYFTFFIPLTPQWEIKGEIENTDAQWRTLKIKVRIGIMPARELDMGHVNFVNLKEDNNSTDSLKAVESFLVGIKDWLAHLSTQNLPVSVLK